MEVPRLWTDSLLQSAFISRVPSCLLSSKFHSVGFWQRHYFSEPSIRNNCLYWKGQMNAFTQQHVLSRENKPWWHWPGDTGEPCFCSVAEYERKPFLAFNRGENTNCMVLLEAQNSIISVRCEDSCNLGDVSKRCQTFWVVGTLICKVFVVRILTDHWLPSRF